jgi:hypothetical protein
MPAKAIAETADVAPEAVPANGAASPGSRLLSLDDILAAQDIKTEYVDVPEWGGKVKVVGLTGAERNKLTRSLAEDSRAIGEDEANALWQVRIVAASLIDEDGKHIAGQSDVAKLARKSLAALIRVYNACARLSGIGGGAIEKAAEELKANPSASSGID